MRRSTFILVFLSMAGGAVAQFPMPDSGAVWVNTLYNVQPSFPTAVFTLMQAESYCVNGADTIVNGLPYVQLHYCPGTYKGAFREAAGRVWYVPAGETQEVLLYDFSALPGDTLLVYHETALSGQGQLTPVVVNSAGPDPQLEGRQVVQLSEGGRWIEGIGAAWGLFSEPWVNVSNYQLHLECMSYLDSTRYPMPGPGRCDPFMAVGEYRSGATDSNTACLFPNPTTGRLQVRSNSPIEHLRLTTVDGRGVHVAATLGGNTAVLDLAPLAPGVYLLYTRAAGLAQRVVRE